jgi:hypothetical protein
LPNLACNASLQHFVAGDRTHSLHIVTTAWFPRKEMVRHDDGQRLK